LLFVGGFFILRNMQRFVLIGCQMVIVQLILFMKKIFSFAFFVLMIVFITSCSKTNVNDHTQTIVLPETGSSVISACNQFAFNFLRSTLQQDTTNSNKLISPLSIYMALSMVYNGANNATKDSIANVLQLSGIDINSLNAVCRSLITQLPQEDNEVQFSIANSIWYNDGFQPLDSFLNTTQNFYEASVQPLDFDNPASVNTINNWVAQKTNNKITKVIDVISSTDLMYLIDAIYFNGAWQSAFKTSDTHNDDFYLSNGSAESVPFMQQELKTTVYSDSAFSLLELPYGSGKSYSMYIALPANQQQPISTFASLMNENILSNAINKMDSVNIQVDIPKWEYSYSIDNMQPELSMLGMGIAFDTSADFSKMYNPAQVKPYITKAIHKTYIKVDEEGTVAAAVTAIGIGTSAIVSSPPVFKVNHPFLYAIIEKQTGTVLFTGIVNDPSAN
jgi:serine protease inhibitor